MSAAPKHTPATLRIQARLERLELEHLRQVCAAQAELIEELQRELADADRLADNWQEVAREAAERTGAQLALSQDGQVGIQEAAGLPQDEWQMFEAWHQSLTRDTWPDEPMGQLFAAWRARAAIAAAKGES